MQQGCRVRVSAARGIGALAHKPNRALQRTPTASLLVPFACGYGAR
jgi:hypothetical protein